jgi:hypothetical protein
VRASFFFALAREAVGCDKASDWGTLCSAGGALSAGGTLCSAAEYFCVKAARSFEREAKVALSTDVSEELLRAFWTSMSLA